MTSTHSSLYFHLVFSTKNRLGWIKESWESRLYAYMGGILRQMGAVAERIGGVSDHVHILASLRPKHRPADVLMELKSNSSGWLHQQIGIRMFEWQEGYGAFLPCLEGSKSPGIFGAFEPLRLSGQFLL